MTKLTRSDRFLQEMKQVVPWKDLMAVVSPYYQEATTGRKKTDLELLLRMYCLQLWYNLSDPALEDAVHDRLSFQRFLELDPLAQKVPDETTLVHFRHLLEQHALTEAIFARVRSQLEERGLLVKTGTIVDATILSASGSTKNQNQQRDPEMSSTRKGNQWHFGLKAHIGVDATSGLVHTVRTTTAKIHDSQLTTELVHGEEKAVIGDSAYGNMMLKTFFRQAGLIYMINDRAGNGRTLSAHQKRVTRRNASVRAKVEFPFRIVKQLWGHTRARYRGLMKNASQLFMLFALTNLYQVRRSFVQA